MTIRTAPPLEERIQYIVRLMASGEWETGQTAVVLGKKWGLDTNTVEKAASEASRIIKRGVAMDEDVKSMLLAQLSNCVASAQKIYRKSKSNERIALDALKVKIEGLRVLVGATPAKRPDPSAPGTGALSSMSSQELREVIDGDREPPSDDE